MGHRAQFRSRRRAASMRRRAGVWLCGPDGLRPALLRLALAARKNRALQPARDAPKIPLPLQGDVPHYKRQITGRSGMSGRAQGKPRASNYSGAELSRLPVLPPLDRIAPFGSLT